MREIIVRADKTALVIRDSKSEDKEIFLFTKDIIGTYIYVGELGENKEQYTIMTEVNTFYVFKEAYEVIKELLFGDLK